MTPKEVRAKWLAALRSGEYEQGTGYLEKDGKFCCLGVLCDLAVKEGMAQRLSTPPDATREPGTFFGMNMVENKVLPEPIQQWAGLCDRSGVYGDDLNGYENMSLTRMNDTGESFAAIADLIESNPPKLFCDVVENSGTSMESTISEGA